MKILLTVLVMITLISPLGAAPRGIKVTNRQYPDGSGSSKLLDPEKRTAEETFVDSRGRTTHKIVYGLDERQQPASAHYYSAAGVLVYKATYKLDGADRIIQEVMMDKNGKLLYTRNYNYGTRNGRSAVLGIDLYDDQNRLVVPAKTKKRK